MKYSLNNIEDVKSMVIFYDNKITSKETIELFFNTMNTPKEKLPIKNFKENNLIICLNDKWEFYNTCTFINAHNIKTSCIYNTLNEMINLKEKIKEKIKEINDFHSFKQAKLSSSFGKHRTIYLKWKINKDLSLRYHFHFQDRKNLEHQYIIKSHKEKDFILVDTKEKLDFIFKTFINKNDYELVIGKLKRRKYNKSIIKGKELVNVDE